jgi:F-type H+-transporting ATPase subunit b
MHIDWWTLALQAINLLILVWILAHFFYRPIAGIIAQRRAAAAKGLAEASAMRDAAEAERAKTAATRAGFSQERDALLADARKQIDAERGAMLRDASDQIETLRAENQAMLARDEADLERHLAEKASDLAVEIARKLLGKLPGQDVLTVFLDALSRQITDLPPKSRDLLAASAQSGTLTIMTAVTLNEREQRQCESVLESALGSKPRIDFKTDASLIAGLELHAGALILKNSWQADLSQILAQLRKDDGQE